MKFNFLGRLRNLYRLFDQKCQPIFLAGARFCFLPEFHNLLPFSKERKFSFLMCRSWYLVLIAWIAFPMSFFGIEIMIEKEKYLKFFRALFDLPIWEIRERGLFLLLSVVLGVVWLYSAAFVRCFTILYNRWFNN